MHGEGEQHFERPRRRVRRCRTGGQRLQAPCAGTRDRVKLAGGARESQQEVRRSGRADDAHAEVPEASGARGTAFCGPRQPLQTCRWGSDTCRWRGGHGSCLEEVAVADCLQQSRLRVRPSAEHPEASVPGGQGSSSWGTLSWPCAVGLADRVSALCGPPGPAFSSSAGVRPPGHSAPRLLPLPPRRLLRQCRPSTAPAQADAAGEASGRASRRECPRQLGRAEPSRCKAAAETW